MNAHGLQRDYAPVETTYQVTCHECGHTSPWADLADLAYDGWSLADYTEDTTSSVDLCDDCANRYGVFVGWTYPPDEYIGQ